MRKKRYLAEGSSTKALFGEVREDLRGPSRDGKLQEGQEFQKVAIPSLGEDGLQEPNQH